MRISQFSKELELKNLQLRMLQCKKGTDSLHSIAERRVPELIPVLGSQTAGITKPVIGCRYLPPGLQLHPQPLRGLLSILLLDEERYDGYEQFA